MSACRMLLTCQLLLARRSLRMSLELRHSKGKTKSMDMMRRTQSGLKVWRWTTSLILNTIEEKAHIDTIDDRARIHVPALLDGGEKQSTALRIKGSICKGRKGEPTSKGEFLYSSHILRGTVA